MNILAIIPARGGSKRLPNKNLLKLGNKPLINWTIDLARHSNMFCDLIVSTDSEEIALTAKQAGATVPWLRPHNLSIDTSTSIEVVIHTLNWYEEVYGELDGIMLLQPTSPFRTLESISKSIAIFEFNNFESSVVSVSHSSSHPAWTFWLSDNKLTPVSPENFMQTRSQDLPDAVTLNGSIYLATPKQLRQSGSFLTNSTIPFLIESPKESIDIDTEFDFKFAQFLIGKQG